MALVKQAKPASFKDPGALRAPQGSYLQGICPDRKSEEPHHHGLPHRRQTRVQHGPLFGWVTHMK